jgi:hypothetical protein
MSPTLSAIGDSITFMEEQLESEGVFPYFNAAFGEDEISVIGNLGARLVRLRRAPGSWPALETMKYQNVADCFLRVLGAELATNPYPKPVGNATANARQLSLFSEDSVPSPEFSSAA